MTTIAAAAVLGMIINPACGNVAPGSELSKHLQATAMMESGGDPYVIGINADPIRHLSAGKVSAMTSIEATSTAAIFLAQHRTIDLGLLQINDRQLTRHNLTLVTAFDVCANIRAGAEHLASDYNWTMAHRRYNCGDITCGVSYAKAVNSMINVLTGNSIPIEHTSPADEDNPDLEDKPGKPDQLITGY